MNDHVMVKEGILPHVDRDHRRSTLPRVQIGMGAARLRFVTMVDHEICMKRRSRDRWV
jgi:hypothetical protein